MFLTNSKTFLFQIKCVKTRFSCEKTILTVNVNNFEHYNKMKTNKNVQSNMIYIPQGKCVENF